MTVRDSFVNELTLLLVRTSELVCILRYLCERLIQSVEKPRVINYSLRSGRHNVDSIARRLKIYETSFFPSTLVAWKVGMNYQTIWKRVQMCSNLKKELGEYLKTLNVSAEVSLNHQNSTFQFSFYCTGYTYGKIQNQIRYGPSPSHMHLFTYNITDNPFCPECHDVVENSSHYFLKCGKYDPARTKMMYSLKAMLRDYNLIVNLDTDDAALSLILCGLRANGDFRILNERINFEVITFMSVSKRFSGKHKTPYWSVRYQFCCCRQWVLCCIYSIDMVLL